jgi:hypothetical protein
VALAVPVGFVLHHLHLHLLVLLLVVGSAVAVIAMR